MFIIKKWGFTGYINRSLSYPRSYHNLFYIKGVVARNAFELNLEIREPHIFSWLIGKTTKEDDIIHAYEDSSLPSIVVNDNKLIMLLKLNIFSCYV